MRRRKIAFTADSLFHVVLSAVESFPNEVFGFLLSKNRGEISDIYVVQSAKRSPTEVVFDLDVLALMKVSLEKSLGLAVVGSYHSHCGKDASPALSEEDKESLPLLGPLAVVVYLPYVEFKVRSWKGGHISVSQQWRAKVNAWEFVGKRAYKLRIEVTHTRRGWLGGD